METGFFLGANSQSGFVSRYDQLPGEHVYIIKGGPGCGKSTFMRRVAENLNTPTIRFFCSSDPKSLDAVYFPKYGVSLVDGTSPHVIEPKYPLAVEEYVNLSAFFDSEKLALQKSEIISTTNRYKRQYERAYRLTACAGLLRQDLRAIAERGGISARIVKKAKGIVSREIRPTGRQGRVYEWFLSALSPEGAITHFDAVSEFSERVYVIEDSFGLSHLLLKALQNEAKALGHTVYSLSSPLDPTRIEHLILPDARLSFITTNKAMPYFGKTFRKIRMDAMQSPAFLRENRGKIKFSKALCQELTDAACEELAEAKRVHDELEALYHPCIDFTRVLDLADEITKQIEK